MSDKAKSGKKKKSASKVKGEEKSKSSKKSAKSAKQKERDEKKASKKGDGSFPDILVVTKEKDGTTGKKYFAGHNEDLGTLYTHGETVAVYKLRRVSTIDIRRKVTR